MSHMPTTEQPDGPTDGDSTVDLTNDAATAMVICEPVYSSSAGGMNRGIANGTSKSRIQGLVADTSVAAGEQGSVAGTGLMIATTAQWDAVCGTSGGLTFDTTYYLHPTTPGRLTATAPLAAGQEVVPVISALSTTKARIAIQPAILL